MTVQDLVVTLRQGRPITARLVREIIIKLERLNWTERSFSAALENYGRERGDVRLSAEESAWVCDGLDAHNALKESVSWMLDTMDACAVAQTKIRLAAIIESALSFQDARKAVEELVSTAGGEGGI